MSARSASGRSRNAEQSRPSQDEAARGIDPQTEIAGLNLADQQRTGEDVRRRGWFWHWNTIVTQYAPLIGLKGVGLLNSYTVWTDRRDESPHRGFAFPSQQSEADFYGEDRAELITINQILVALDLLEIRKEMVLRADEKGQWRAPQNFYRVKDHGDGYNLTANDVMKVVELADAKPPVYRYVRNIFSARFAPIDSCNVWAGILAEVSQTEAWRRLAEKTQRDEARASARAKAGHESRKASLDASSADDAAAPIHDGKDSGAGEMEIGPKTNVADINRGLATSVESANKGLDGSGPTLVEPANTAGPTSVAPVNRTYNQSTLTTTTTSSDGVVFEAKDVSRDSVTGELEPVNAEIRPAPGDGPSELRAILAFEESNGRGVTPAERKLLAGIAQRFDGAALRQSPIESGWSWVAAAVYEAVDAGSAFVAPRRVREILNRWEREGAPGALTGSGGVRLAASQPPAAEAPVEPSELAAPASEPVLNEVFMIEECGLPSVQVWAAVLDEIVARQNVARSERDNWLRPARLGGRGADGELIVIAPSALAQKWINGRLRRPLKAAVAAIIGREIEINVRVAPPPSLAPSSVAREESA